MKKRGQFYLVAAIVISIILISLVTVSNYLNKKEDTKVYDLSEELGIESDQVLLYGTVSSENMDQLLTNFSKSYSYYASDKNTQIYFVFINGETITQINWKDQLVGSTGLGDIEQPEYTKVNETITKTKSQLVDKKIEVDIGTDKYYYDLPEGDNVYFVIRQQTDTGEVNVATK